MLLKIIKIQFQEGGLKVRESVKERVKLMLSPKISQEHPYSKICSMSAHPEKI